MYSTSLANILHAITRQMFFFFFLAGGIYGYQGQAIGSLTHQVIGQFCESNLLRLRANGGLNDTRFVPNLLLLA